MDSTVTIKVCLKTERDRGFAALAKEWSKKNKLKSFIQNATATAEHNFS